jgi:hypothetical protein
LLPLAALVAGYAWFVRSPNEAPGPAEQAPLPGLTSLPVEPSAKPTRAVPRYDPNGKPRPIEPLPPLAELAARADGGDARAACQLAAELQACRQQAVLAGPRRVGSDQGPPTRCSELIEKYGDRHFTYLRQAAFAGEPEAMLRYAAGEAFGVPGESYAFLSTPNFDTWRREAPAMLQSVFEAGYAEAALHLMLAQEPMFGGQLAALLPPDPLRERARAELLVLFAGQHPEAAKIAASLPRADPALQREAQALARRWHVEYFNGLELDPNTEPNDHGMPLMAGSGQACSQPDPELKK